MRRFTRLTNGLPQKVDNHMQSVDVHFMYYNFGRILKTLRVTPAMTAGVADKVWDHYRHPNVVWLQDTGAFIGKI